MRNKLLLLSSIATFMLCRTCVTEAQWVQDPGPFGGSVFRFASDGTAIYAGLGNSASAGSGSVGNVYRSTDNGTTWSASTSGLPSLGIWAIYASGGNLLAATTSVDSYSPSWGAYRSTDHGVTWAQATMPNIAGNILSFTELGGTIFAATDYGLIYTTDAGATWQNDTTLGQGTTNLASITKVGTTLLAAVWNGGLQQSTDTGKTWTTRSGYGSERSFSVSGTDLYAASQSQIQFSSDSGAHWTSKVDLKSNVWALTLKGSNLFAGTSNGAFRSTDNGTTWTELDTNLFRTRIYDIFVSGTNLFIGSASGAYRSSDDGATWDVINYGLAQEQMSSLVVDDTDLFMGTGAFGANANGGIFHSMDKGANWTEIDHNVSFVGTGMGVTALSVNGSSLFATFRDGVGDWYQGLRSTDRGKTWQIAGTGLGGIKVTTLLVHGTTLFAGTANTGANSGIYRSTDSGQNWHLANNGLTTVWVNAIVESGTNLFVGTYGGGVFRSTDNGANWSEVNDGLTSFDVFSLAVKGSYLYAGTNSGGVFRSSDNGDNWMPMNTGLTKPGVTTMTVSGTKLFAGTNPKGVYLSTDDGASWTEFSTGLVGSSVETLAASSTDLFVGVYNTNVWHRSLSDFVTAGVASTVSTSFELSPNPTTGTVNIRGVEIGTHLSVLNLLGETVLELTPRSSDFSLDLSRLLPGTYCVRLLDDGKSEMRIVVRE